MNQPPTRDPVWTGITRHGTGYRAQVYGGHGQPPVRRQFPAGTSPQEMQRWRKDMQASQHLTRRARATAGAFAVDAKRYLEAVAAMPTIGERRRIVAFWIAEFGTTPRDRITSVQIRTIRDRLLTEPRSDDDKRPLAPATVNIRLRALSNLFSVLDGRRSYNPVRDVPEATEPDPVARAIPYDRIAALIGAMTAPPSVSRGTTREAFGTSATKIRVTCLAYCQITPGQLAALTPDDLDLAHGRLRLPARQKGTGRPALWIALTRQAVEAFTAFDRASLYGSFSQSSLRKSFKLAATKAGIKNAVRPYDLRHSFATAALHATASTEAVAELMQHGSAVTTKRYVMEAEAQMRAAHGAAVVEHFDRTVGQNHGAPPVGGGAVGSSPVLPVGSTSGIYSTAIQRKQAQSSTHGIASPRAAGPRLVRTKRRSD